MSDRQRTLFELEAEELESKYREVFSGLKIIESEHIKDGTIYFMSPKFQTTKEAEHYGGPILAMTDPHTGDVLRYKTYSGVVEITGMDTADEVVGDVVEQIDAAAREHREWMERQLFADCCGVPKMPPEQPYLALAGRLFRSFRVWLAKLIGGEALDDHYADMWMGY